MKVLLKPIIVNSNRYGSILGSFYLTFELMLAFHPTIKSSSAVEDLKKQSTIVIETVRTLHKILQEH